MKILGLHHITLGSSDAQRTVDFYSGVLGLRFVKRTVNFDDPASYHLYFGDETGRPGTAITFFEWPGAKRGASGIGGTHHFALTVANHDALLKWKRRLVDLGIRVRGPYNRTYFESIYFSDPDGAHVELATRGPGLAVDEVAGQLGQRQIALVAENEIHQRDEEAIKAETWPEPVTGISPDMALRAGMHHISAVSSDLQRTAGFYEGLLGLQRVKMTANYDDPTSPHWYWSTSQDAQPGTLITYFGRDPKNTRRARMGAGQTHHFALAVENDAEQLAWREKLVKAGQQVSPVMDRSYFHSIYTSDPDGHIVELATLNPGFAVDEPVTELGTTLKLPDWLEPHRAEISAGLHPLHVPEAPVATVLQNRD
ncbi:MAG TPA: VOC family protein [Anaerolineae bacterium]